MDLIGSLVSQLGLGQEQAQGLAGSVLGALNSQVKQSAGTGVSAQLESAIPELASWQSAATGLGGQPAAGLGGVLQFLGGLNLGGEKLGTIGKLVQDFLQERLGGAQGGLYQQIAGAAGPLFAMFGGGGASRLPAALAAGSPSVAGLLGGMFAGK